RQVEADQLRRGRRGAADEDEGAGRGPGRVDLGIGRRELLRGAGDEVDRRQASLALLDVGADEAAVRHEGVDGDAEVPLRLADVGVDEEEWLDLLRAPVPRVLERPDAIEVP